MTSIPKKVWTLLAASLALAAMAGFCIHRGVSARLREVPPRLLPIKAVRDALAKAGHDVVWAGDWPKDPGDKEILARAQAEERTLVTLDKDLENSRSSEASPTSASSDSSMFR